MAHTHRSSAGQQGPEATPLTFLSVQRDVEAMADALFRQSGLDPHADDARLRSWRAELALVGVNAFRRVRLQVRSDAQGVAWKTHAKRVMAAKLENLMAADGRDAGDDDGPAAVPAPTRPQPTPPGPSGLILTFDGLHRTAVRMAAAYWARRYRAWSSDSELAVDIRFEAAVVAVDRVRRRWEPERSGLLWYVFRAVQSAVDEEFRRALNRKNRHAEYVEAQKRVAAAESRDSGTGTEDLLGEADAVRQRETLAVALATLTPRRRNEILLRLVDDRDRTQPDHNAYSRGLQDLRDRLDDFATTEARADAELASTIARFLTGAGDGAVGRLPRAPATATSMAAAPMVR